MFFYANSLHSGAFALIFRGMPMFEDENEPRKKTAGVKRNLVDMSVGELEEYIIELENEIKRAKDDIAKKKASQAAAAAIFKS